MTISLKVKPVEVCLNLALAAISPLQAFIDQPGITHEFCNQQALQILRNDGLTRQADFFSRHLKELNLGVYWADKGWRNANHYFEPLTGRGCGNLRTPSKASITIITWRHPPAKIVTTNRRYFSWAPPHI
jgi:hypothetical protein